MSEVISQFFGDGSLLFAVFLVAAVGGLYSERSGVVNIAIDGMMIIGGLVYSLMGKALGQYSNLWQLFALVIAGIIGGLFALLHGFAAITLKSNQIISGTALNLLASGLGMFFVTIPALAPGNMIKTNFALISIDRSGVFNIFMMIAVVLAVFTFIFFRYTKVGVRYAACGENPHALDAAGINVIKIRYLAVFISGFLASIAGAMFTHFISNQFRGDMLGQGYLALAIMICGQWRVQYITLGSILFSILIALSNDLWRFTGWNIADTTNSILKILPYACTILVMIIFSKYSKVPKADGIPFDKSMR